MVVMLPLCHGPSESSGQGRHLPISTSPHSDATTGLSEVSVFIATSCILYSLSHNLHHAASKSLEEIVLFFNSLLIGLCEFISISL